MKNSSGKDGEAYAARFTEARGYRILERNYRQRCGEIDLIAENGSYIAFIEVKTRSANGMVSPMEAVTPCKQRKIYQTALHYLSEHPTSLQPRFDVVGILTSPGSGKVVFVQYLENAFNGS